MEYPISINGKVKMKLNVPSHLSVDELKSFILSNKRVVDVTEGMVILKVIVVPERIINLVTHDLVYEIVDACMNMGEPERTQYLRNNYIITRK